MRDLATVIAQALEMIASPRRAEVSQRVQHILQSLPYTAPEMASYRWKEFGKELQSADMDGLIADEERMAIQALLRGET